MKKRYTALFLWLTAVLALSLCGTAMARMFRQSEPLDNLFIPAQVDCLVHEELDGSGDYTTGTRNAHQKTGITVENIGNIDAFIRLRFVTYWVDEQNRIVGLEPTMPAVNYNEDAWLKGSGNTYYHKAPVAPGGLTAQLLDAPMVLTRYTDPVTGRTYDQVVEVFADAIQSKPDKAARNSWQVEINQGMILTVS